MGSKGMYLVVFDVGTTAVKTIISDAQGSVLGRAYEEYPTMTPSPGIVEQNPEDWWKAIKTSAKQALDVSKIDPNAVVGVGVSTQRGTVAAVDKDARVLYPAMTWMDDRKCPSADALAEKYPQRVAAFKILWLKDNLPGVFDEAHKFATVDAYIHYKLTGNFVSDFSNSAFGPLDVEKLKWSDELSDVAGIPVEKLPSLLPPGEITGELLPDAAKEIGLVAGTPVAMGGGDQQCSALGLGAISPGIIKATTGTGTFIDAVIDEPLDFYNPTTRTFCIPHVIHNKWSFEAVMPGMGLIYRWFRDQFFSREAEMAKKVGLDPYDILNLEAQSVKPGSDGLIIIPLFMLSQGIFRGLSFSHTRAHIIRAILESNGYAMRFFIEMMELQGIVASEVRVDGGGARPPLWRQIQADITGKPIVLTKLMEDASALGAAILAGLKVGIYKSIDEAIGTVVRVIERRGSIQENREIYDGIYPKFQEMLIQLASELKI